LNTHKLIGSALAMTALAVVGMGSARANIDPIAPATPTVTLQGDGTFLYSYPVEVTTAETLISGSYFTFFDVNGLVANSAFATPGVAVPTGGSFAATYNFLGPVATGNGGNTAPTADDPTLKNVTFTYTGGDVVGAPTTIGTFGFRSTIGTTARNNVSFSAVAEQTGSNPLKMDTNSAFYSGPVTTVPEPASVIPFALGGLGLLGLIARKTRRSSGAAA